MEILFAEKIKSTMMNRCEMFISDLDSNKYNRVLDEKDIGWGIVPCALYLKNVLGFENVESSMQPDDQICLSKLESLINILQEKLKQDVNVLFFPAIGQDFHLDNGWVLKCTFSTELGLGKGALGFRLYNPQLKTRASVRRYQNELSQVTLKYLRNTPTLFEHMTNLNTIYFQKNECEDVKQMENYIDMILDITQIKLS